MSTRGSHWWWVNIGSGNGLVPSGTKPLPEPMLTQLSDASSPDLNELKQLSLYYIVMSWCSLVLSCIWWDSANETLHRCPGGWCKRDLPPILKALELHLFWTKPTGSSCACPCWFIVGCRDHLWMCPASERWCYNVITSFLIGWVHSQNDPCVDFPMYEECLYDWFKGWML